MLFLRTDESIRKRILVHIAAEYSNNPLRCSRNENDSPIFEILNVCDEFGILNINEGYDK